MDDLPWNTKGDFCSYFSNSLQYNENEILGNAQAPLGKQINPGT